MNTRTALLLLVLAPACMTKAAHEEQLAAIDKQRNEEREAAAAALKAEQEKAAAQKKKSDDDLAAVNATLATRDASLASKTTDFDNSQKALDEANALVGELKKRLEKLGQNVNQLSGEKGAMAAALDEAKGRLEELRRQKAAAEERAAMFRGLVDKLKAMIEGGQLKVTVRNGKMLIVLGSDVLFDSGSTQLKPAGKQAIASVAAALSSIKGRQFAVAGHTDNVPMKGSSNWELSTARAVEVTRLLIASGVAPESLAASGYGEFDPVAPNDTKENKALNRRIEIEMKPNLSELPSLEGLLNEKKPS